MVFFTFLKQILQGLRVMPEICKLQRNYLKFGQWIGIVPFHVTFNRAYSCKRLTTPQAVVRCVLQLVAIANCFFSLYSRHSLNAGKNPSSQLGNFIYYTWSVYFVVLFCTLWRGRDKIARVLNHTQSLVIKMDSCDIKMPSRCKVNLVMAVLILHTVGSTLLEWLFIDIRIHVNNPIWTILEDAVSQQRNIFIHILDIDQLPQAGQYILTGFLSIMKAYVTLGTHYADQLCLSSACLLYLITRALTEHLKTRKIPEKQYDHIVDICCDLVQLAEIIEEAMGVLIFCCCFSLLPYYSYEMKGVIEGHPGSRLQFSLYMVTFASVMIISAETNSQMHTTHSWLRDQSLEQRKPGSFSVETPNFSYSQRTLVLLTQISTNYFGLKGRAFTITYGFVGNLAGLIITYSVIIVQFQDPKT